MISPLSPLRVNAIASAIVAQPEPDQHLVNSALRLVARICKRLQVDPGQIFNDLGYPNSTSHSNN